MCNYYSPILCLSVYRETFQFCYNHRGKCFDEIENKREKGERVDEEDGDDEKMERLCSYWVLHDVGLMRHPGWVLHLEHHTNTLCKHSGTELLLFPEITCYRDWHSIKHERPECPLSHI